MPTAFQSDARCVSVRSACHEAAAVTATATSVGMDTIGLSWGVAAATARLLLILAVVASPSNSLELGNLLNLYTLKKKSCIEEYEHFVYK